MFLPRLRVFEQNNEYYVANGKFNTYGAYDEIQIPNCTLYSLLRSHEAIEAEKREKDIARKNSIGFGNAKDWFEQTGMPTGSELREGSVAVFDGDYGHVVFIEEKIDDTHAVVMTQSSYNKNKDLRNWEYWSKREVELVVGKATISGVGALKGFIYMPINDIRVERDTKKEQIEIIDSMVNVRTGPNQEVFCNGLYCPKGIFNVKSVENDGTYNWYELEENHWVREGEWLIHYDKTSKDYKALYEESERKLEKICSLAKQIEVICNE